MGWGAQCDECGGVVVDAGRCVGHLREAELGRYVSRLADGEELDARGATLGSGALDRLTKDLDSAGVKQIAAVRFEQAKIEEDALLGAFEIMGPASFQRASFEGFAAFPGTTFAERADFSGASFAAGASFDEVTFAGDADFSSARFAEVVRFDLASFGGRASFVRTSVDCPVSMFETRFSGKAMFNYAGFREGVEIGPLTANAVLCLDGAVFQSWLRLVATAKTTTCRATRFKGGAELALNGGDLDLTEAGFERQARVSSATPVADSEGEGGAAIAPYEGPLVRLLSLRRAGVQYLSLSNLDLRACRFHNAHNLDEIRIEPNCEFAPAPSGARYTRRITIAEEHQMRSARAAEGSRSPEKDPVDASRAWYPPPCQAPAETDAGESATLEPTEIVGTYRALRKALEDRGDIPGAGDFYYGEMEMRRLSSNGDAGAPELDRGLGERLIVTLYWLTSGYGLRASRSFACLLAIVLIGGIPLYLFGFDGDQPLGRSVLFSLESAISVLRAPELDLAPAGEVTQVALRLLGPVFLGLALLALRGRVKR